ncbi:hypothetical protein CXG81DRAFT_19396 [Caulochytrium protostelioides]|uniref:Uncharacterized protein n=1 Tax=Caulochytrium protostelioides TaxID=1555241 RepID=A0A4P9X663_9FUNG|nr:hypothetical protein CXG81DRAFT_19396 [Caulochytrium protostelioides]|eukprot:RKP00666.1 hypothetical protein CXG81DRAFT_19396 [Caulochytrium protostelioides]
MVIAQPREDILVETSALSKEGQQRLNRFFTAQLWPSDLAAPTPEPDPRVQELMGKPDIRVGPTLSAQQAATIRQIVMQSGARLATEATNLRQIKRVFRHLDTQDAAPVTTAPYGIRPDKRKKIDDHIRAWAEYGIIESCTSP